MQHRRRYRLGCLEVDSGVKAVLFPPCLPRPAELETAAELETTAMTSVSPQSLMSLAMDPRRPCMWTWFITHLCCRDVISHFS